MQQDKAPDPGALSLFAIATTVVRRADGEADE
jgi:hypothetical protein